MIRSISRRMLFAVLALFAWAAPAFGDAPFLDLVELPEKPEAPPLRLVDLTGAERDLATYRGRTVVINFWATWCAPCIREMPALDRLGRRLEDAEVVLLTVNMGEDPVRAGRFLADRSIDVPVLLDRDRLTWGSWQLQGLPTTYVVTPEGVIHYGAIGARDWDDPRYEARIRRLAATAR